MTAQKINLAEKLALVTDHWTPKTVGVLNDYELKVVKVLGEFVWHQHDETDELFLVIDGELTIDLPDGPLVLTRGETAIIPRGLRHRPRAERETAIVLLEPAGIVNTGEAGGPLTATPDTRG